MFSSSFFFYQIWPAFIRIYLRFYLIYLYFGSITNEDLFRFIVAWRVYRLRLIT